MIESNDAMLSGVPAAGESIEMAYQDTLPTIPVLTDVVAPAVPVGTPPSDIQPHMPPADPAVAADPVPVAAADPATVAPEVLPLMAEPVVVPDKPPLEETFVQKVEAEADLLWRELRNYLNRLPDELQGKAHAAVSKLQKLL